MLGLITDPKLTYLSICVYLNCPQVDLELVSFLHHLSHIPMEILNVILHLLIPALQRVYLFDQLLNIIFLVI